MESGVRQGVKNGQTAVHGPMRMDFVEGISPSMRSVETVMREVAQSEAPVLLLAERGAGKKATASRVHELSRRGRQPFRVASCAAIEPGKFAIEAGLTGVGTVFLDGGAGMVAAGLDAEKHERPAGSGFGPSASDGAVYLRKFARPGSGSEVGESS